MCTLGMICEPSHLRRLNSRETLEGLMKLSAPTNASMACVSVDVKDDIYYPAYEPSTGHCYLQKEPLLFSCVGEVQGLSRLCSCRDYIRGQTALCSRCL